jgi:hypothetical protein
MAWWLMKIVLQSNLLKLKSSMYIYYVGFSGINNDMEFTFSIFWTIFRVLIDLIFASTHTSFVLLQL